MKKVLIVLMLVAALTATACGKQKPQDLNWKLSDFTFTDQNGKPFGLADLKGKVWVADFIFTNCTTVCTPMTYNMNQLKERLKKEKLDAEFVSFTVDPNRDNPETLKQFAERFTEDLSNWHFLTGYTQEEIKKFAKDQFKTIAEPDPQSDQFVHQTLIYLVDQNGTVVKAYSGTEPKYDEMVYDIEALLE